MTFTSFLSNFLYGSPPENQQQSLNGEYTPIPQPPTIPFLGNANQIDLTLPVSSFLLLWKQYGEIYALQLPGRYMVAINSQRLAEEVLDEKRFHKSVAGPLKEVRNLVGDGLFTAYHGEPTWGIAHRILMPAFSPGNIKNMFEDMFDILSQLILKWERFGPEHNISPTEDFTRLAFETVCYCTMGYRLNSFYSETTAPFIVSMGNYLLECQKRSSLPSVVNYVRSTAQWDADRATMYEIVDKVISDRKRTGVTRGDLLDLMLQGKDPETGKSLDDETIRKELLTFMIAGHETTSGALSFMMHELIKSPTAYNKLRQEIDTVLGKERIRYEHFSKLPYLIAVMREALRLRGPIGIFAVTPFEDTVIGGKYFIPKGTAMTVQNTCIHRDPAVWGDDAEEFKPERMLDGKFEALPPKAWLPFGSGARGCIGRAFAWQEIIIAAATIFQRFDLVLADESYSLRLKQTLTLKPDGLTIHAIPRANIPPLWMTVQEAPLSPSKLTQNTNAATAAKEVNGAVHGKHRLDVLYGSNTGSCEAFAQRIASAASSNGFVASISTLDAASNRLSKTNPTVIVTASFEGQPADNAGRFVADITSETDSSAFEGVVFAVFGCGNRDWATTYQRIPKLIDETLAGHGATRLLSRGEADASGAEFFDSFDAWEVELWKALNEKYHIPLSETSHDDGDELDVKVADVGTERATLLRQPDAALGRVVENRHLTVESDRQKRHLEFALPEGMKYAAGDYLAILPTNPPSSVKRALKYFGVSEEATITINSRAATTLPTGKPVLLKEILSGYVELALPASKRSLDQLTGLAEGEDRASLEQLVATYKESIVDKRVSVLDLLYTHPSIKLSIGAFLAMLPAMRVRQYSISSSPLWNPTHVTLTVSVLSGPSRSGSKEDFLGVASNFLANLHPGDLVQLMVRPSAVMFSLPTDVSTPLVLACAGSGFAPMRGFIQERAVQIESGRKDVGKVLLFMGCRDPEKDFIYGDSDLKKWIGLGAVDVRPAFSRASDKSEGCKYVQDRILKDSEDVMALYLQNARFYTCGSSALASGVREACIALLKTKHGEAATAKFKELQTERYATEIFG